jgi:hypothetical protein
MASMAAAAAPAWLAELSEAWIEPPAIGEEGQGEDEEHENCSSSSSTGSVVVQEAQQQQQSMMDFGSIVVKDSLLIRQKTATTAAASEARTGGQLAYAVAAMNGAGAGNLLATPKTPNKLAMLFMRGGDEQQQESKIQETSPTPAKTVQQQQQPDNVEELAVEPEEDHVEESRLKCDNVAC